MSEGEIAYAAGTFCEGADETNVETTNDFATLTLTLKAMPEINFVSFSVMPLDFTSLGVVLSAADPPFAAGDLIKDHRNYATWYDEYGFYGHLTDIDPTTMYVIQVASDTVLEISGKPVSETTEIRLSTDWNYLPYLKQTEEDVTSAMPSFTWSDGDLIKDEDNNMATYSATEAAWMPDDTDPLSTLKVGKGYKLKVTTAGTIDWTSSTASQESSQQSSQAALASTEASPAPMFSLKAGDNSLRFDSLPDDKSLHALLPSDNLPDGSTISDGKQFAEFRAGMWVGQLQQLEEKTDYTLKLSGDSSIAMQGNALVSGPSQLSDSQRGEPKHHEPPKKRRQGKKHKRMKMKVAESEPQQSEPQQSEPLQSEPSALVAPSRLVDGAAAQAISLKAGSNTVSFDALPADRSLSVLFASANLPEGSTISNGEKFAHFAGGMWVGQLQALEEKRDYTVKVSSDTSIAVFGATLSTGKAATKSDW